MKGKKEEACDFVVIGAGVAGLSAAMYAARVGLKTLVLGASHGSEMPIGGIITTTKNVENYPGFESISGAELAERIRKHAASYELVTIKEGLVEDVEKKNKEFVVESSNGRYSGKTLLFATGGAWRKLSVPGAKEFENKGIAYCALCDAPLYKNKVVAVVGGSDAAIKDAIILAEYAKKVFIIYRGEMVRAEQASLKKAESNKKIEIITKTNVIEVRGDSSVKKVILDNKYEKSNELGVDGVFVAIGHEPMSELAKKMGVKTNEKGEIIINHKTCETNVEGVYAAGDVTDKPFKQAIIGVAEGCTAAYSAFEHLKKSK
jgi:thioredoxin reductase (NADPH)